MSKDMTKEWILEEIECLDNDIPKLTEDLLSAKNDLLEAVRAGASDAVLAAICRDFAEIEYDLSLCHDQREAFIKDLQERGVAI